MRFLSFSLLFISLAASASDGEVIKNQVIASTSVVYAKDKEGNDKIGVLWLIMDEGKKVQHYGSDHWEGSFLLRLERHDSKSVTTKLDALCEPIRVHKKLVFPCSHWPIVVHDFNGDGISEFNLSQPGNSWGNHYMLLTFSDDGSGRVETVEVDEEHNYLHPQAGAPSTHLLIDTKEGFKYLFTERGAIFKEVSIHYRWNAEEKVFEESKRVSME